MYHKRATSIAITSALMVVVLCQYIFANPAAASDQISFEDHTQSSGIAASHDRVYLITGQAWGDFDNDGYDDLYTTSSDGTNTLWRNRGDGTFDLVDPTGPHALADQISGGASFVDYDHDSDLDLLVLARGQPALLQAQPEGGFVDVASATGLTRVGDGESAAWADFDGDGWLDLYIANWYYQENETAPESRDALYRNNGDGTFTDVTDWLDNDRTRGPAFAAIWFDYDNDGDSDLYVVNDKFWGNLLWRNDGPGCNGWCFSDVSVASGTHRPADSMGVTVGDYDNDGDLDIAYSGSNEMILLQNRSQQGTAEFIEVTAAAGLTIGNLIGWGVAFADFNNDGWADLYLNISGGQDGSSNLVFRNNADGTFTDVSASSEGDNQGPSMGLAVADHDQDGDLDVLIGNLDQSYRLYRNRLHGDNANGWLQLRLIGPDGTYSSAVGARVTVQTSDGKLQLQETQIGSGLGGNHSQWLHFGLAQAQPVCIDIRWPDGQVQKLDIPKSNRIEVNYPGWLVLLDGFEANQGCLRQ